MVDDIYKVRMRMSEVLGKDGKITTTYKILEVLDFHAAPRQTSLEFSTDEGETEPPIRA